MCRYDEAEGPLTRAIKIVQAKGQIVRQYKPESDEQEKEKQAEITKIQQELGILLDTQTKLRFEQKRYPLKTE